MEDGMINRFRLALIVDDNEIDSFILRRVMESHNFCDEILIKSNAKEVLVYLARNDSPKGKIPEIIFLDLNMPLMNGFEFLHTYETLSDRIREHTKIIVVTTSNHPEDKEKACSFKYVSDYFVKPLSPHNLNKIVIDTSLGEVLTSQQDKR